MFFVVVVVLKARIVFSCQGKRISLVWVVSMSAEGTHALGQMNLVLHM